MTKSKNIFQNAILFFIEKGKHPTLGKVKLAKLLFFADMLSFKSFRKTITGEGYIKLPLGPVPENFDQTLLTMQLNKLINKPTNEFYTNYVSANLELFTKQQKEILNLVLTMFKTHYTRDVVDISHKLLPWDTIELYEPISFELIGLSNVEAMQLKIKAKELTTTDIIMNSPDLIASFKKGRDDVRRNRVKEHKWV